MTAEERSEDKKKVMDPVVSVCTPTGNRSKFINAMIQNMKRQDFPPYLMEWLIVEDGSEDMYAKMLPGLKTLPKDLRVRHFYLGSDRMPVGQKRNVTNALAKGQILVYMDDDDIYSPQRVSHCVETLNLHPNIDVVGSSVLHILFTDTGLIREFGPYGPNHATGGTMAFRRRLLAHTRFDETKTHAEEKSFLRNYSIPMAQLNPFKCILCISHKTNTFDKKKIRHNGLPTELRVTKWLNPVT